MLTKFGEPVGNWEKNFLLSGSTWAARPSRPAASTRKLRWSAGPPPATLSTSAKNWPQTAANCWLNSKALPPAGMMNWVSIRGGSGDDDGGGISVACFGGPKKGPLVLCQCS